MAQQGSPKNWKRFENGRLVYYGESSDDDFWERKWLEVVSAEYYRDADRGKIVWFLEEQITRWLPRVGPILEAGCGLGHLVLALMRRGYEMEGVESSSGTVSIARKYCPDLPIRVGDVTRLEVPDSYYSGYISLGVMEHRKEGPQAFLGEARRVLKPGGIALISVPYLHCLRRIKVAMGLYRSAPPSEFSFYQYAFREEEFRSLLESQGFRVLSQSPYDGLKGLKDELPALAVVLKSGFLGRLIRQRLAYWKWAATHFGHMMLFICRRE